VGNVDTAQGTFCLFYLGALKQKGPFSPGDWRGVAQNTLFPRPRRVSATPIARVHNERRSPGPVAGSRRPSSARCAATPDRGGRPAIIRFSEGGGQTVIQRLEHRYQPVSGRRTTAPESGRAATRVRRSPACGRHRERRAGWGPESAPAKAPATAGERIRPGPAAHTQSNKRLSLPHAQLQEAQVSPATLRPNLRAHQAGDEMAGCAARNCAIGGGERRPSAERVPADSSPRPKHRAARRSAP